MKNSDVIWTMLNASITTEENATEYNTPGIFHSSRVYELMIFYLLSVLCNLCGLVGNGSVIWILTGCRMRNRFATRLVNLAIADFGTLLCLSASAITHIIRCPYDLIYELLGSLISFMYAARLYLLADISLETCLTVLFPIWNRYRRPRICSSVISFLFWFICDLVFVMLLVLAYTFSFDDNVYMENALSALDLLIFAPIIICSALIMSIKIFCGSRWRHPPRLYIAILVTLQFFIVFTTPLSITYFITNSTGDFADLRTEISYFFASVNSSANPIIYYFVGRERKQQGRESLKLALQRLFKDEANLLEEN